MNSSKHTFERELKKKLAMKASGYTTEENILLRAFKYFDLDNSGFCNEKEFIQTIQKIGITGFSDENLSELFKDYDIDKNGKISYKEFVGILFNNQSVLNEVRKNNPQRKNENEEIKNIKNKEDYPSNNVENKNEEFQENDNFKENNLNEEKKLNQQEDLNKKEDYEENINEEENIIEEEEEEKDEEENNINEEEDPILLKIKESLRKKGLRTLISLESNCRLLDQDNSQTIDYENFNKLSNEYQFNLTDEESEQIFQMFDTENNGRINYDEFIREIRGEISEKRGKLIENIFEFLYQKNNGDFKVNDLENLYIPKNHPDVLLGKKSEKEAFEEFINTFNDNHIYLNGDDNEEGFLTVDEFIDYYESVSFFFKKFKDFERLVTYVWGLKSNDEIMKEVEKINKKNKKIVKENKRIVREKEIKVSKEQIQNDNNNIDNNYNDNNEEKQQIENDKYDNNNPQNENDNNYEKNYNEKEEIPKKEEKKVEEKTHYQNFQNENDPFIKFRNYLRKRGVTNILSLSQQFKICDDDGSHKLEKPEFTKAIKQANLDISDKEINNLFNEFDVNNSGKISYDEFMKLIITDLNERRKNVVLAAFNRIDLDKSGIIELNEIKSFFNTRNNPEVALGKKTEEEVFDEFIQTFKTHHNITSGIRDKRVTLEEFIDYYKYISASIPNDDLFVNIVISAWKLNNYKDFSQNATKDNIYDLENEDFNKNKGNFKKPYKKTIPYGVDNEPVNYSTMNRPQGRKSDKLSKNENPLSVFKKKIKLRGSRGILSLRRTFLINDDNNSNKISFQKFQKYIYDYRFPISDDQIKGIFSLFDKDNSGEINYINFIKEITGNLSDFRKNLIIRVFEKLDTENKGFIDIEDIRASYNPKRHPDVLNGKKTEQEILSEFIDFLDYHFDLLNPNKNSNYNKVYLKDFLDFYNYISLLYDDDEYFEHVIMRTWGLSGNLNFAKGYKGSNRIDYNAENNY